MEKKRELLASLPNGLQVWHVHIDYLREADKNARTMTPDRFKRLVSNIDREGRLESLPLCYLEKDSEEFKIISGHHRTRAARNAGLTEIPILTIIDDLSNARRTAKQLAHNALEGADDQQILKELYDSIDEMEAKQESGIIEEDVLKLIDSVKVDDVVLPLEMEVVQLLFLPNEIKNLDRILDLVSKDDKVLVADLKSFSEFKHAVQKVVKAEDIRNVSAILVRMLEIVEDYYDSIEEDDPEQTR